MWLVIVLFSGVLLVGGLLLFFISRRTKRVSKAQMRRFQESWKDIEFLLKTDPRQAVLQADALLAEMLRAAGFQGSVGDMLKQAGPRFTDNNSIWRAHKLRNRIAHELKVSVSGRDASKALAAFRRAYADLGLPL